MYILCCIPEAISGDGCAKGFPDMDLIIARGSKTTIGALTTGLSLLSAFTCSGNLTGLVLGVDVRTENETHDLYPEIFLQRLAESDEPDGGYDTVPDSVRTVRLTPANFSTSGAFDYTLDPPLEFENNDILTWNQPDLQKSVVRLYTVDGTELQGSKSLLIYPVTGEECSVVKLRLEFISYLFVP